MEAFRKRRDIRPDSTTYPPSAPQGHHDGPEGYNGWKNRETWNVALWLSNDQLLYGAMCQFARYKQPYLSLRSELRRSQCFHMRETPDGVSLWNPCLDIDALDEMIREAIQ